ncbi:hypothetical protein GCM10009422_28690 [Brevundimonas kwangchunensis]|uniref:DUF2909 domain-containing protein n=1 Tax=Brevundimonas kwangchunensis TaxID=322163 RepID=A0ABN1H5T1_9CAUL
MTLTVTLIIAGAVLALAVFAGWRGALPSNPAKGVRMVPWRLIMLMSGAALMLLLIHAATLLGMPQRPY